MQAGLEREAALEQGERGQAGTSQAGWHTHSVPARDAHALVEEDDIKACSTQAGGRLHASGARQRTDSMVRWSGAARVLLPGSGTAGGGASPHPWRGPLT